MKEDIIDFIEVLILKSPPEERPHWVSHFVVPNANELMIKIKTKEGLEGFGLATSYTDIEPIVRPFKNHLAEEIIGMNPFYPELLYEKIFNLTDTKKASENKWSREAIIRISAALDIACWDLIGKKANLPLYKVFGGYRNKVPCYITCAYYRDNKSNSELEDEILKLVDQGHRAFKIKVGALSLGEDMKRVEIVRNAIGYDRELMIDVNRGWNLKTAIEGCKLLKQFKPTWIEEPVRWADDRRELKILSRKTNIPISGGESENTIFGCRSLIEENAIQILQFDCTMFGGFTNGKKLAALCELNHVEVAPHHDCNIHAHLVASTPMGKTVESFDSIRDPLQSGLFENPPEIKDGWIKLNDQPGLGLTVSDKCIKKIGKLVYKSKK